MTQATKRGMLRIGFGHLEDLLDLPEGVRITGIMRNEHDLHAHCFTVHIMAPADIPCDRLGRPFAVPFAGECEDSMYLRLDRVQSGESS